MRHIKQIDSECFPTVLAMLADCEVNEVIAAAQVLNPNAHSWSELASKPVHENDIANDEMTFVYKALARKFAPYLVEYCLPVNAKMVLAKYGFMKWQDFVFETSVGRGAVLLASRFYEMPVGHIAAFENGLIYCGNMPGPIKAIDYYRKCAKESPLCPYKVVKEGGI